jgi:alkylated DNA nucleotide flippase Atl1
MNLLADAENVPIAEAASRGVSRLAAAAEAGQVTVLRRHSVPVAAVVSYGEVQRLSGLERDLTDVALVLARAATDSGSRTALDDVIGSFGFTRDELDALDDPA